MTFNQEFDEHGVWRKQFALRLKLLSEWLSDHDLLEAGVRERLDQLHAQVKNDKMMVAFVAEFSRGKSELINAVFFAGYGRRIMPASAGRTTMCPTELGYDAEVPPCLRLLPIETRLQPQSLLDWRNAPDKWERVDLDVNDPQQLARAIQKVAEVRRVSQAEAASLGFWNDETPNENPLVGSDGLIEVPKWRHALINMAHPLLKQGLVILDTPGLNAIGAEPELTVSLLPQAHAVVFILAADTGVTKSDLGIWREHLSVVGEDKATRLVVLNKIDTMWDALSSPEQVQLQIASQRSDSAEILGLAPQQVLAVSAQKGLLAKVSRDDKLLQASNLMELEAALGEGLLGQRRRILAEAVSKGIQSLRQETGRLVHTRARDILEQIQELDGLRGKNTSVIKQMRLRIEQEQADFDASGAKIQAVRSVHLRLLKDLFAQLGNTHLKSRVSELARALKQPGIKLGVRRAYGKTFERLAVDLNRADQLAAEIQSMLEGSFKNLNAEYGFSLQPPTPPQLSAYHKDLALIEKSHLQYLSLGNALRLAQPEFAERLARALMSRLRVVYDTAVNEVELWNKSAAAQLDAQLRERRRNFTRRIEAVSRIQQAAGGLDERIRELQSQQSQLNLTDAKLAELTDHLLAEPEAEAIAA
ncbi:MAG TPA: dynamin family protein [Hydrogenophaga sp.]|uniref:dynamin family protein n=1 Tax=Hydrogenophaga sp. TaxID=1904254 RepID=UPI0008AC73C5|nr:dynamin family protein [Hydrogenophaga sp.]OGA74093.1 MAG: dynamin family protein [Burkholderiales bacterium GWE1_65_30]OGA90046.1 MAG: dynamin family protein [Burkholderiales bacterium GWF1_66_17]HAX18789.1 dynamin family protein [Hydrogenophaga sp.]HBU16797.1 dynamin family protein [Hydrogenophaga sp.]